MDIAFLSDSFRQMLALILRVFQARGGEQKRRLYFSLIFLFMVEYPFPIMFLKEDEMRFALSLMLSAAAVLSACADSSSQSVPGGRLYTDIGRDGASFTGRYSPSDFSQSQVRFMISSVVCGNSGLSNFAQETVEEQIRFSATCDGGSPYGPSAGVNFFLRGPGTVEYFATFESNGAIVQESAMLKI